MATIGLLHHRAVTEAQHVSASLRHALASRIRIEQAKGIVAERLGISVDRAFQVIRRYARDHQRPLGDVVAAILDGTLDLHRPSGSRPSV